MKYPSFISADSLIFGANKKNNPTHWIDVRFTAFRKGLFILYNFYNDNLWSW